MSDFDFEGMTSAAIGGARPDWMDDERTRAIPEAKLTLAKTTRGLGKVVKRINAEYRVRSYDGVVYVVHIDALPKGTK